MDGEGSSVTASGNNGGGRLELVQVSSENWEEVPASVHMVAHHSALLRAALSRQLRTGAVFHGGSILHLE
jgi:hypothetical protein